MVWDALDPRNVYLNTVYFKLSRRMCNLVAKIVHYIVWCRLRHGQTDRRTDESHNNGVTNHEVEAVKRSISLTTLVKQYNLVLLVWEGNRGSNPRMNLHCRRVTHGWCGLSHRRSNVYFIISHGVCNFVPNSMTTSYGCLLYTSPSPRDGLLSRMPSSA